MKTLWRNLRYTFCVLRKNPNFTVVAVLSLALGIGANTAIYTLINALLLRKLPVRQPERVHGELLMCPEFREFSVSCYDEEMRDQQHVQCYIGQKPLNGGFSGRQRLTQTMRIGA
jgi:hypothetical protein